MVTGMEMLLCSSLAGSGHELELVIAMGSCLTLCCASNRMLSTWESIIKQIDWLTILEAEKAKMGVASRRPLLLCLPSREEKTVTVGQERADPIGRTSTCGNWNTLKVALICKEELAV